MRNGRILSDEQLDEMIGFRERGWSTRRIAEHFTAAGTPISVGSIEWQCLLAGADTLPKFRGRMSQPRAAYQRRGAVVRPYSPADDALLRQLDHQGATHTEIGRRLGRKPNSIKGRLLTLARHEARAEAAE